MSRIEECLLLKLLKFKLSNFFYSLSLQQVVIKKCCDVMYVVDG